MAIKAGPIFVWGLLLGFDISAAPVLTVRVYNHAALAAAELEAAEREAANIFLLAGIDVVWVDCGTSSDDTEKIAACDRVAHRNGPALKLLPESMAAGLPRPTEQFAIAVPSMIFVFCQRVHEAATKAGLPEFRLLGDILAHELGHEVLGASGHSAAGIMKARLTPEDFAQAERGLLRFTPTQVRLLQASLK
jgi:hypothetical protein